MYLELLIFLLQWLQFPTRGFLLHQAIVHGGTPVQAVVDEAQSVEEQTSQVDVVVAIFDRYLEGVVAAADISQLALNVRILCGRKKSEADLVKQMFVLAVT